MEPARPPISRETRLLLTVVMVALAMLWVLARIRFPDRPPTPNPVPPVLAQLAPQPVFDDLAAAVAQIRPRIESALAIAAVQSDISSDQTSSSAPIVALRWREDLGIARADASAGPPDPARGDEIVARAAATSLALVRIPPQSVPPQSTWLPRRLDNPRFLIAVDPLPDGLALRPVFVGALSAMASPRWSGAIWVVPPHTALTAGTFVFTTDGSLAGLVTDDDDRLGLVPADLLFQEARRLEQQGQRSRGSIGVEVTSLTRGLASALGATAGVAVTWVDPKGPAAGRLRSTEVIEKVDGASVPNKEAWDARMARVADGETIVVTVRRGDDVRELQLIASASSSGQETERPLGLTLRTVPRVGAEVLRVDSGSAAARAGLQAGDVVTVAAGRQVPTANDIRRSFADVRDDRPLAVAVTRGDSHLVLAIEKTW